MCETVKPEKKNATDANGTEAHETAAGDDKDMPAAAAAEAADEPDTAEKNATAEKVEEDKDKAGDADKESVKDAKEKKDEPKRVCKMKDEKRIHRVALTIESETPLPRPITVAQFKEIKKELEGYEAREKKIRDRAAAFNALESYIYVTREKLDGKEELIAVTSKEWRDTFNEKLGAAQSWLDEDGWEATTEKLQEKL